MIKILVWGFIFYLAYKFLFDFLLPVGKVAKDMKQKVNDIHEQQAKQQHTNTQNQSVNQSSSTKVDDKDYIDFEEIK